MRKTLSILLALCLMLSLAACDAGGDGGSTSAPGVTGDATGAPTGGGTASSGRADSNLESTTGRFLHMDGYTYFIAGSSYVSSLDTEDGKWYDVLGVEYSLLRMGDGKSDEAQTLIDRCSALLLGLTCCDGKIWCMELTPLEGDVKLFEKYGCYNYDSSYGDLVRMRCITPDGKDAGGFTVGEFSSVTILGGGDGELYFCGIDSQSRLFRCDLRKGEAELFVPEFPNRDTVACVMLSIGEGYVYFTKRVLTDSAGEDSTWEFDSGIWRVPVTGGSPELVTRLDADVLAYLARTPRRLVIPSGDTLYLSDQRDFLYAIDMETGDVNVIAEDTGGIGINVTGDGAYCLLDDALWSYDAATGDLSMLLPDEDGDWEKYLLAVCGDWIYYVEADTSPGYYRMPKTAKSFPLGSFYEGH